MRMEAQTLVSVLRSVQYVQTCQECLQQEYSIASLLQNNFFTYIVPLKSFTSMFISKDFPSDSIKVESGKKSGLMGTSDLQHERCW